MNASLREVIIAVITAAITAGGLYWQFKGNQEQASADRMDIVFRRIGELEVKVAELNTDVIDLSVENTKLEVENAQLRVKVGLLQSQVNYGKGSHLDSIFDFIERMKVPAWCKVWVDEDPESGIDSHFEMAYINTSYEYEYEVTKAKYIGATDFQVHPVKLAQAYLENDLRVFRERAWLDFTEAVMLPDGTTHKERFYKFYHNVEEGPELVCGLRID